MDSTEALLLACKTGHRVVEVPTRIRKCAAGNVSTRHVRLVYDYMRLLVVMLSQVSRRPRAAGRCHRDPGSRSGADLVRPVARAHVVVIGVVGVGAWFLMRMLRCRQSRGSTRCCGRSFGLAVLVLAAVSRACSTGPPAGCAVYDSPNLLFLLAIAFLLPVCVYFSWELSRLEERAASSPRSSRCCAASQSRPAKAPGEGD